MSVTWIKLKMNPVWKLNFFLFNIEGYGEFFSDITPTGPLYILRFRITANL
jgi:hypothetical protein